MRWSDDADHDEGERLAMVAESAGDVARTPVAILAEELASWAGNGLARDWLSAKLAACGVPPAVARNGIIPCRAIIERGVAQILPEGAPAGAILVRSAGSPIDPDYRLTLIAGEVVDAVIFDASDPDRWALRFGVAKWLGAVPPQGELADPIPIWCSPLQWLRASCRGLVLLTPNERESQALLKPMRVITAQDDRHAAELQRIIDLPPPGPIVVVPTARARRRA